MMRRVLVAIAIIVLSVIAFAAPSYAQDDITRFGTSVVIREGETAEGNVTTFGGNATIDGVVEGDVSVFGGNFVVNGTVKGNATNFGGNSTLGNDAVIEGNFTHFGGSVNKSPGARIEGNETSGPRIFNPLANLLAGLFSLIISLGLAALVVAVLPEQTAIIADTVESRPLPSAGAGFLATILIPVVFLFLVLLIIVGWILIPFVAIAIPLIYFYGYVGVSRWLGRRIISSTNITQQTPIAQVLIGVLVLGIVGLIPVFGWLVVIIASLVGLGAVILSKFGTGRPWFGGRATPPPEAEERGAA